MSDKKHSEHLTVHRVVCWDLWESVALSISEFGVRFPLGTFWGLINKYYTLKKYSNTYTYLIKYIYIYIHTQKQTTTRSKVT